MTEEVVRVSDTFYILSTSARIDDRTQVLKQGDTFAIFDRFGDIVHGYPYLLQLVGHGAWRAAGRRQRLTVDDVTSTIPAVKERFSLVIMGIIVVSVLPIAIEMLKGWRQRRLEST